MVPYSTLKRPAYQTDLLVDLRRILALAIRILAGDHLQDAHAKGIDVDLFAVALLLVHFGRHELRRSYARLLPKCTTDDRVLLAKLHLCRPHVANLDLALAAVDEDVVALDVAVDDWRGVRVQVLEALQNLAGPPPDDLDRRALQLVNVPTRKQVKSSRYSLSVPDVISSVIKTNSPSLNQLS